MERKKILRKEAVFTEEDIEQAERFLSTLKEINEIFYDLEWNVDDIYEAKKFLESLEHIEEIKKQLEPIYCKRENCDGYIVYNEEAKAGECTACGCLHKCTNSH
jgi:hypothetical protein